jgi:hypothetical protein
MCRFHGEIVSFLSEVKLSLLLIVYQVCRCYVILQNICKLGHVFLNQTMINHSISGTVWTFNTETELWSLIEAKGDIPVSYLILRVILWQIFMWKLTKLSSGAELRQLEAATRWLELVLHWYFLAVRTQKERNGMTFTCLIWSHQHGFHWTISKS